MLKKLAFLFIILLMFLFASTNVFAETSETSENVDYDFWQAANEWFESGQANHGSITAVNEPMANVIARMGEMINILGTTVIALVTIFLGIKYMYGSFEAKGEVKESLMSLLVVCVFFFGWNSIWTLLFPYGEFIFNPADTENGYIEPLGIAFSTATMIANFLAIGAVLYMGIRYIFAGASGKAELKAKSGQFLIGMIMAFCTVGLLNYISAVVNQLLRY